MFQLSDLQELESSALELTEFRNNRRVVCPVELVQGLLGQLKSKFGFDFLTDVTAVDYLEYAGARDRYGIVYCLLNTVTGERIIVKTHVNDPNPSLPSVCHLWAGANWMEREVFDMFGIEFTSHPDLRRILSPDEFAAFPLRKDYPLQGLGERHNFPVLTRSDG